MRTRNFRDFVEPRLWAALRRHCPGSACALAASMGKGLGFGLLAAVICTQQTTAASDAAPISFAAQSAPAHAPKRAQFEGARASLDTRYVADWVVDSGDNQRMPFAIVDKTQATVFVFDAAGRLRGAAPALLGLARGDESVPGIGERKLSSIRPAERTTPAGRFVAALDRNMRGEEILWVDYDTAVSMHRVINTNLKERRPQRLATATPLDNRISYGCINVPVAFYENVLSPAFTGTSGIVYVLPETRTAREVFASYDVGERARLQTARLAVPAQLTSGATGH